MLADELEAMSSSDSLQLMTNSPKPDPTSFIPMDDFEA